MPTTRSTTSISRPAWWLLRQIWDKGSLYQGHKVVPYCPRCGTAISSHEVAQGYKDVTEDSIYVRFALRPEAAATLGAPDGAPISLAVWTTTPWTLISNVGVAVHPDVTYALAESRGERFVLARELVEKALRPARPSSSASCRAASCSASSTIHRSPSWSSTSGRISWSPPTSSRPTDGTGIVHMAPAFGEDYMRVYVRELAQGVAQFNREHNHWVIRFEDLPMGDPPPGWLKNWKGDGILIRVGDRRVAAAVRATGLPAVAFRWAVPTPGIPAIGTDHRAVSAMAAAHLRERGFRHFAACGLTRGVHPPLDERVDAFVQIVKESGYPCHVFEAKRNCTWEQEQAQIARWLRRYRNRPA